MQTIKVCLEMIYTKFEVGVVTSHVVVVGDGKTYRYHLLNLKKLYGSSLSWMLPFPGDWHILKNLQPVPNYGDLLGCWTDQLIS